MVTSHKVSSSKNTGSDDLGGLSVLLLDENKSRGSLLRRSLEEYGYLVAREVSTRSELHKAAIESKPHVLVIGIDLPDFEIFSEVSRINTDLPLPVVMFAEKGAPKLIKQAVHAGISAFVVDDIQPQRLSSIITIAVERFKVNQALIDELNDTKSKLAERKILDRAKAMMMKQQDLSEGEAYAKLRKMSMDKGMPLAKVAQNIIDVFEMMNN